jgi:hypothetical protein
MSPMQLERDCLKSLLTDLTASFCIKSTTLLFTWAYSWVWLFLVSPFSEGVLVLRNYLLTDFAGIFYLLMMK